MPAPLKSRFGRIVVFVALGMILGAYVSGGTAAIAIGAIGGWLVAVLGSHLEERMARYSAGNREKIAQLLRDHPEKLQQMPEKMRKEAERFLREP